MLSSFRTVAGRTSTLVLAAIVGLITAVPPAAADAYTVQSAESLLQQGRIIEAKHALLALRREATNSAERERILELLAAAERRLGFMDRAEISLQKAELALAQGDLRTADLHASAARRLDSATPEQRRRASDVLDQAAAMRVELEPLVAPALDQAVADFENERYAEAKAGLSSVVRSGATLTRAQLGIVNRYQQRIFDLERERGETFELDYIPLGVLRAAAGRAGSEAVTAAAIANVQDETTERPETIDLDDDQAEEPRPSDDLFEQAARFDAERILSEANVAYEAGRYAQAIEKYTQATTTMARYLTPEQLSMARDRLLDARTRMGREGVNIIDPFADQRGVMREQTIAEYDNFVGQARQALAAGDTDRSRQLVAQARLQWNNAYNNGLFAEEEFQVRKAQLDQLDREVINTEERIRQKEIETRRVHLEQEAREREQFQGQERQRRINESLDRLRQLQAELKYEEALQVVDQVLFLDPNNPAALLMKDVLKDVIFYREWEKVQRDRTVSYFEESLEMQRGLIIPDRIMSYPPDWPEISFRRGDVQSFVESEADRRVLATLEATRIPATFQDNALEDVLSFIATVVNVNLDVDWEALRDIGIERDSEVTLELREVPARVVLDRVLSKVSPDSFSRAGWAITDGILVVSSDDQLRENTFIVIYDIRDLLYEVPDFSNVPTLDLDQILQQSGQQGGGGGGSIFQGEEDGGGLGLTPQELLDRLLEIIQTNVDFEGWRDNGGNTGTVQPLNGNLIITNTARNHREIQGLLNQLREIRAIQIHVETRFLSVTQNFFEQIGFDVDVYFNANNNQVRDARRQAQVLGYGTLAGEGLSLLPVDVAAAAGSNATGGLTGWRPTEVDLTTGQITYGYETSPFSVSAPDPLSVIPVQSGSDLIADAIFAGTDFASSIMGLQPALGIAGTFLDDIQVDFLVEATQADRRNVTLTAPRLTFVNGKTANIYVATQEAFVSDLTPVVGTGAVAFDPTVSTLVSGFTLAVSGVVSADRRYVTMTIQTGISQRTGFATGTVSAVAAGAGGLVGGEASQPFSDNFQLPILAVTSISTGATIPDKGTLLLGGQRLVTEIEVETGVPVLSKLPIINRFFTNRIEEKQEQTLLILVKPTIVIQNEEEERAYPGLLDRLQNPFR